MNQLATQQQEIETLKSQLKAKDVQIASLEKLNGWYLEQLKLRRQKQFGASSEKCSEDQIAIDDLFADLFNEAWQVNQSNATAKEGESYIQKLFAIEAQADQLKYTDSQRLELRKTESKKTLDEFYTWIDKISPKTLPQSLLGKAITYAQNQKVYLSNFLKDGRIQLSNNLAEQSIKMFVIGRKNWLFSNTQNGATSSSIIYSIIQTAIANELKPMHYLEHVFKQIQLNKDLQISDILPWSASIPETCKKINTPQS